MEQWREVTFDLPWGRLAAKSWGSTAARPHCLLLHGWLDNAGTWDKVATLLTPAFHLVALDLPGHGHSAHLPPGLHYHDMEHLAAIRAVVTKMSWTRFSLIGHSMGVNSNFRSSNYSQNQHCLLILKHIYLGRPCSSLYRCIP